MFDLISSGGPSSSSSSTSTPSSNPLAKMAAGLRRIVGAGVAAAKAGLPTVHSLGIGHGVHRGLLDGMAQRTGGVAQYVVDGESIVK